MQVAGGCHGVDCAEFLIRRNLRCRVARPGLTVSQNRSLHDEGICAYIDIVTDVGAVMDECCNAERTSPAYPDRVAFECTVFQRMTLCNRAMVERSIIAYCYQMRLGKRAAVIENLFADIDSLTS